MHQRSLPMTTKIHLLVPWRGLLVDLFFHILAYLCGYRNKGKVCLWVKAQRFQERGDLGADLVISTIYQLEQLKLLKLSYLPLSHCTVVSSILFTTTMSLFIPLFLINTACSLV